MGLFRRKETLEKKPANAEQESGVSGDSIFSTFDREVERDDKNKIETYRKMRNTDGTVDALYNVVTRPILASTYGVKADPDDEGEEQAEFIRKCLFEPVYKGGMETPFSLVLEQMLKAVMDGFEVFERVYSYDEDGKLVLKKLALRDATTVKLLTDSHGGYDGMRQRASFGGKMVDVLLPASKTFLITYGKADNLLYGRSAFRSIYTNWDKKRKIEYLDSIAIQNSAVRPKLLKRVSNALVRNDSEGGEDSKVLKVLSRLGHLRPVAKIPNGYDVTELEGGNNSGTHEAIERQNSEMARSFLASFIMLGTQGRASTGSYSLSSDQSDLFMLSLKGIMNLITEHINQYWVADLIDLNYPRGERYYPEFYFDSFTDETNEFVKSIFTKLIEKDRISESMAKGIEEMVASRFEIQTEGESDTDEPKNDNDSEDGTDGGSDDKGGSDGEYDGNNPHNHDGGTVNDEKEGDGKNAGKFHRKLTEFEEKVNWDSIARQNEKVATQFSEKATPILEDYIRKVAENTDVDVSLPAEYVKLLTQTYRSSYNYGKMSASDEEGQRAPKTKDSEIKNTNLYVDFIVFKQESDIRNLILEQKMNASVASEELEDGWSWKDMFITAGLKWVLQAVDGTASSIFGRGMNDGRNDAFAVFDQQQDAVYMWSALLENTCDLCRNLDGSVVSKKDMPKARYQAGKVHRKCMCIWVRVTGENKPAVTGFPEDIDEIDHIMTTNKKQLQKEGVVGKDETKVNALRRKTMSNVDNGNTLDDVENAIRGQDYETMAAFDNKGKKIFEWTNNEPSSVAPPNGWAKYFKDNGGAVITHNHPSSSSFSLQDLMTAASNDIPELRIASEKFNYSIKAPEGWPSVEEIREYGEAQYKMFERQAERLISAGRIESKDKVKWAIEERSVAIANKFNLDYNRTERSK